MRSYSCNFQVGKLCSRHTDLQKLMKWRQIKWKKSGPILFYIFFSDILFCDRYLPANQLVFAVRNFFQQSYTGLPATHVGNMGYGTKNVFSLLQTRPPRWASPDGPCHNVICWLISQTDKKKNTFLGTSTQHGYKLYVCFNSILIIYQKWFWNYSISRNDGSTSFFIHIHLYHRRNLLISK